MTRLRQDEAGARKVINGIAMDGKTPLHLAIDLGFDVAVELLLEAGADTECLV